jgi:hypothetical protein
LPLHEFGEFIKNQLIYFSFFLQYIAIVFPFRLIDIHKLKWKIHNGYLTLLTFLKLINLQALHAFTHTPIWTFLKPIYIHLFGWNYFKVCYIKSRYTHRQHWKFTDTVETKMWLEVVDEISIVWKLCNPKLVVHILCNIKIHTSNCSLLPKSSSNCNR